jgi:hypothetical protein
VYDPSGAVVAHATVRVTQESTGIEKSTETTSAGVYLIPDLPPALYIVEVSAAELAATKIKDLRLEVDQHASLDIKLELGSDTQSVTITDASPLLQTEDASVGTVVDGNQIRTLPLNGRYVTQLLELSPGTVPSDYSNNFSHPGDPSQTGHQRNGQPAFDVNGQSGALTFFRLDGLENNEREFGGANIPISVDAVQEFKLQTANFSAEYGRSPAQVDVVTKSGTNSYHGGLFEFLRNDALDAGQWVFNGPSVKNDLKRNQFGGTFGGPLKKNKLFFFFSYDGTREVFSEPLLESVPSAAMRDGVFPAGDVIFNPSTGQRFQNNTIPQSLWNQISAKILPYIPAPNQAGTPNTTAGGLPLPPTNNYLYVPKRTQTINQFNGRVDYNQSERNNYFIRYTDSSNFRDGDGPLATNLQGSIIGSEKANLGGRNLAGAWYHNFSSRTISEFRAGLSTNPQDYEKGDTTDYASKFGLSNILYPGSYKGFPHIQLLGLSLGSGDYRPLRVSETNYQLAETFTLIRGSHSIRIGGDVRRTALLTLNSQLSTGFFYFNGTQTRDPAQGYGGNTACPGSSDQTSCVAGNEFADFLLGDLGLAQDGTPIPRIHKYYSNWAGFVNDSWKVRRGLTLNLGLRYEYQTRFHASPPFYTQPLVENGAFTGKIAVANDSDGKISSAVLPGALNLIPGSVETCRQAGLPDNCIVSQKNGWQPRAGFAWQALPNTVIRGGAGIFFGSLNGDSDTESCQSYPLVLTTSTQYYAAPPAFTGQPALSFSNPFSGSTPAAPAYQNCAIPNRKLPQSYQWNFNVERSLGANTTVSAGYVGSVSRHLDQAQVGGQAVFNLPQPWGVVLAPGQQQQVPYPQFSTVGQFLSVDVANYNSLQAVLQRRFSHGVSFTVNYTYAKTLGTQSWLSDPRNYKLDYGRLPDDLRHVLTISPIYQLPFGSGYGLVPGNTLARNLVSGWTVSTIINLRSGFPFNPVLSGTDLLHLNGNIIEDRPDQICSGHVANPSPAHWFNAACFVLPSEPTTPGAALRQGDTGVDILDGPRAFTEDLGLSKATQIREGTSLEFRAELFNVWNHKVLGLPNASINPYAASDTVGRITTVDALPRVIQFGLKLQF